MYMAMEILNGTNDDDVISFTQSHEKKTFCVSQFREILQTTGTAMENAYIESLENQGHRLYTSQYWTTRGEERRAYVGWFDETGAECKLLRLGGSQWEQGKVRIRIEVEFIPDDESTEIDEPSLDTFRES